MLRLSKCIVAAHAGIRRKNMLDRDHPPENASFAGHVY
jgi:hypothetical protein